MRTLTILTAGAASVLLLAGCSSTPAAPAAATAPPTRTSPTSSAIDAWPDALSAGAAELVVLEVDVVLVLEVTVLQVKDPVSAMSNFGADTRWIGALAKSCVLPNSPKETSTFSWGPWAVKGDDDGSYPASSSSWNDFPKPEYPFANEQTFKRGECVQGWILFAVPKSVHLSEVRYTNVAQDHAAWKA